MTIAAELRDLSKPEVIGQPAAVDKKIINSLQVLRGFAALSVAIGHAITFTDIPSLAGGFGTYILPFTIGVDAFFVISGFIMYYTCRDRFGSPGAVQWFAVRRLARIVPLYWACTLCIAVLFLAMGRFEGDLVKSLLFIPYPNPEGGMAYPVLGVGWTLNYEMLFYALFTVSLLLPKRPGVIALCGAIGALALAGTVLSSEPFPLWFWSRPIILEFLAGVLIGVIYERFGKCGSAWVAALAIGGAIAITPINQFGILPVSSLIDARGLSSVALIAACVLLVPWTTEKRMPLSLIALGDASYALYLVHPIVLRVTKGVFLAVLPMTVETAFLYISAGIVGSLIVAHYAYRFYERPVTEWLVARRPAAAPSVTASP